MERENLLKQYGQRLGKTAQQNVGAYLPHVPTVIQWQNTQLDTELRIRLSETANTPWESVGQLGALNNSGKIQWIEAETFARGNFGIVTEGYGKGIGIGLRQGSDKLAGMFNDAIAAIRENGTYDEVQKKYFEFDVYGE